VTLKTFTLFQLCCSFELSINKSCINKKLLLLREN